MSSRSALNSPAAATRLLVVDGGGLDGPLADAQAFDVFEIVSQTGDLITARSAYLFEVGEDLCVRIEQDGATSDATARVRAHVGPAADRLTELEISDRRPRDP
ncbi:MAG TPA: hypothetical protein VGC42_28225 [Kofleriaceae bacterium]